MLIFVVRALFLFSPLTIPPSFHPRSFPSSPPFSIPALLSIPASAGNSAKRKCNVACGDAWRTMPPREIPAFAGMEGGREWGYRGDGRKGMRVRTQKLTYSPFPRKRESPCPLGQGEQRSHCTAFDCCRSRKQHKKKFCTFLEKRRNLIYNGRDVLQNLPF